jgi:hypothetical protein
MIFVYTDGLIRQDIDIGEIEYPSRQSVEI